ARTLAVDTDGRAGGGRGGLRRDHRPGGPELRRPAHHRRRQQARPGHRARRAGRNVRRRSQGRSIMKWRSLMWILWPSFLIGAATSATVFALIDPLDIAIFGTIQLSRQQMYAGGFFLFWLMAALSSALSLFMAPSAPDADPLDTF